MSTFDHPDLVAAASSWRCPHCRTLQPEATRCRACTRAAVACATCHRFRRSVASDLGYCADDRTRSPLSGDEVRSCWEAVPAASLAAGFFDDAELGTKPVLVQPSESHRPLVEPTTAPTAPPVDAGLVEAPHVPPARRLMSDLERRARARGD